MRVTTALLVAIAAAICFAGDKPAEWVKNNQIDLSVYGPWKDGSRRVRAWSDVVCEQVVAEGLSWGTGEKGLGQRLILDYGHIYVDGVELPVGKLVRVTGKLERRHMGAAPPGAQGYGRGFDYFCIDARTVEPLDQVRAPMLMEADVKK